MKQIVFSLQLLFFIAFMCFSCQVSTNSSSEENTETSDSIATVNTQENVEITTTAVTEAEKDKNLTDIYRSDGYRPNMVSEWIEVKVDQESHQLLEIWYWNVQNEEKVKLTIVDQEYVDDEISGYSGTLQFPDSSEKIGFGIIEDRFNLTWTENDLQEFIFESE